MTVFEAINRAKSEARDRNKIINNIDVRNIMAYTINISQAEVVVEGRYIEITTKQKQQFFKYVNELLSGKPLQYITNKQYFMDLDFYVDENVLIPQPDTEVLVEQTIRIIDRMLDKSMDNSTDRSIGKNIDKNVGKPAIKVLDLCTGSGAIAIALKYKFKNKIDVTASDISDEALKIAKKNSKNILGNEEIIRFINSDMFKSINEKYDVVVSNPPYIEKSLISSLPIDVQNEPHIALDGGEDGLDFYRAIKQNFQKHIIPKGYLLLEIGYDQRKAVSKLFPDSECIQDYAGNDRVIVYRV